MKAYVFDTEDLKLDPSYQENWDDMIINVSLFNWHPSEPKFLYSLTIREFDNACCMHYF